METNQDKVIYFVRHAKDDSRYRGGWSRRPLIREGDIQAINLAERIKQKAPVMNVRSIISSDLPRAVQTAQPVAKVLGLPIVRDLHWRESNNGKLAGMLNREAERRYPGMYWSTLEMHQRYPGGESPIEFYERISETFSSFRERVLSGEIESNTMVFTHSGVISIIYSIMQNKAWTNKNRSFDIPYTSVHVCNITANKIERFI